MQFSTILIATAALAMTVIAAPVAGDEPHGSTNIEHSGNSHKVGDVSQSGNTNLCSNQADRTTQACCNKSNKSGGGGFLGAEILSNAEILSLQCAIGSKYLTIITLAI